MNILHISSNYPPLIGGPAASVPYIAREQAKRHKIYVLTHGLPKLTKNSITVFRCGEVKGEITNLRRNFEKALRMGILGRKIVKAEEIDVIHAHDPNISAIAAIIAKAGKKIPSVVKYSGDLAWELLGLKKGVSDDEDFWNSFLAKSILTVEKLLFSKFDCVVVQSNYQRRILEDVCGVKNKIVQIPNGVEIYSYSEQELRKARNELPKGLKVASVCRLVPWKGIEFGIKAMRHIDGNYVVFGDGIDKQRLKEIAKREGVERKVVFFGKIPHENVQLYLRCCDVLLVPSIYEPFGIAILDGFAAGIPVIGSNVGGIPELLERDQLFEKGDIEEIVEKINFALEKKDKIVRRQKRKLRRYRWKEIAVKLEKVYGSL